MEMVVLLFRQNLVMLIYLLIGYALFKKRIISVQGSGEIGNMLITVIIPFVVINSFLRDFTKEMLVGFLLSLAATAGTFAVSIAASTLIFHRRSLTRQFAATFSNAGFIGIPLIQASIGAEAVFYVASYVAALNVLQWTYGVWVLTEDRAAISLKKIAENPTVISAVLGLLLFFLPVKLPGIAVTAVTTLASMSGPLAMIILGTSLAQVPFASLFTDAQVFLCSAIRLLVIPVVMIFAFLLIPETYMDLRYASLIAAASPVGSNAVIFAQRFGKDYRSAAKDVCLSTLLCIVTIPLVVAAASLVW